ncbi:hypothetical protein IEO21_02018 [Rhodonia placenta]|uniref:Uncharacterized protein n=1 Tax=Rhodonia placenta TaxID=104341 RepID=A0A8H7P8R9_9APHY|nr:hypothetical protein IEO21_02018 [Postia placenta]
MSPHATLHIADRTDITRDDIQPAGYFDSTPAWPAGSRGTSSEITNQLFNFIMPTEADPQVQLALFLGIDPAYAFAGTVPAPSSNGSVLYTGPGLYHSDLLTHTEPTTTSVLRGGICSWQSCGHTISALSPGRVMQHLRWYHLDVGANPLPAGQSAECCWVMRDGTLCGKQVVSRNLGKHVAAVHLKCTARECDRCGRRNISVRNPCVMPRDYYLNTAYLVYINGSRKVGRLPTWCWNKGANGAGARLSTGVAMPVRDNRVRYVHCAGSLYIMIGASGPRLLARPSFRARS